MFMHNMYNYNLVNLSYRPALNYIAKATLCAFQAELQRKKKITTQKWR